MPAFGAQKDLVAAIARATSSWPPSSCRVMPENRPRLTGQPIRLTKVWTHRDYPLIEIGPMVLNKNQQLLRRDRAIAFSPGIWSRHQRFSGQDVSARLIAYAVRTSLHRVGVNVHHCGQRSRAAGPCTLQRDGAMAACRVHLAAKTQSGGGYFVSPTTEFADGATAPVRKVTEPPMRDSRRRLDQSLRTQRK